VGGAPELEAFTATPELEAFTATPELLATTPELDTFTAAPELLATTPELEALAATPELLALATTPELDPTTLEPATLDPAMLLAGTLAVLDPGLVAAIDAFKLTVNENVAFVHSYLTIRLLVESAAIKKIPGKESS